ncbi:MAG: Gfo/Idh/MocA family oxidoreductase, partial [Clostridia bacterium]|nr:Gfo/Idh/MocA family oxidoreductase [Clostridia bacterium]
MLNIGIIGCGTIAHDHAKALQHVANARLVGGCDSNPENAKKFCELYGCRVFASAQELVDSPDIDAVYVCTPSGLHRQFTVMAAQAKKHVLTEKPIATTLEDADAMIDACAKNGVTLGVVSQLRFYPDVQATKKAIEQGKLGVITVGDAVMKYHREPSYFTESPWRGTWALNGGGIMVNQAIHGIDLLLYLVGKVRSVTAHCKTLVHDVEVEDTACALVEFENGAVGSITATTSVYRTFPRRININGSDGSISLQEEKTAQWDLRDGSTP